MKKFSLRPWQAIDAESAAEHATERICRYMSDGFPGNDENKWEEFVRKANTYPSLCYRAIEIDGHAAGGIGAHLHDDILRLNAEMGYWLAEAYHGQGIITEAIREMVKLVFDTYAIQRIYATPFGNNFASQRVLEKAGFKLEAMFEDKIIKNDQVLDELVYAIRRSDWEKSEQRESGLQ
jgi:[ribosomal protein S5]-alanine N-acetyltransferase